jgi:hypothetical protein
MVRMILLVPVVALVFTGVAGSVSAALAQGGSVSGMVVITVEGDAVPATGLPVIRPNGDNLRNAEPLPDGSTRIPAADSDFAPNEAVIVLEEECRQNDAATAERALMLARENEAYERQGCAYRRLALFLWGAGTLRVMTGNPGGATFTPLAIAALAQDHMARTARFGLHRAWVSGSAGQGMLSADEACAGVAETINSNPAWTGGCATDKSGLAIMALVGLQLIQLQNMTFGVELGYGKLGRAEQDVTLDADAYDTHYRQNGFFSPSTLLFRITAALWLYNTQLQFGAGMHRWSAKSGYDQVSTTGSSTTTSSDRQKDSGTSPALGVAVSRRVRDQLLLTLASDAFWMRSGNDEYDEIRERALLFRMGLTWYFWNAASSGGLAPAR